VFILLGQAVMAWVEDTRLLSLIRAVALMMVKVKIIIDKIDEYINKEGNLKES
jgi:hypothetical protein